MGIISSSCERCRVAVALLGVLLLTLRFSFAQEAPLHITASIEVQDQGAGTFVGRALCDPDGNLYFRLLSGKNPAKASVTRLTADGKNKLSFDLGRAPDEGARGGEVGDYAVDARGRLYLLTRIPRSDSETQPAIARFSADGQFDAMIKIDASFVVWRLGVFPSGELLLSGFSEGDSEGHPRQANTVIGVFSSSGEPIKILEPRDDIKLQYDSSKGSLTADALSTIGLSILEAGEDGYIYLMRPESNPSIYVISPSGTIVRKVRLLAPGEGFRACDMKLGGGRFVVEFRKPHGASPNADKVVFSVFELEGTRVIDYLGSEETVGHFACYTPNAFTFLGPSRSGHMTILRASIR
jgi:hypothetical protein